jgi:hypothetical protein
MGRWSMAQDRELIKLARTASAEEIARKLDKPLPAILKAAKRLGINPGAKKTRPRR